MTLEKAKKEIVKLSFYILQIAKGKIPKEKIQQIAADEIRCLTEEEIHIKRIINALSYMYNNVNQTFNNELLEQLFYLLTNDLADKNIVKKIVKLFYENFDNSAYYLNSIIHLFIIKHVSDSQIEFAFIISEWIMLRKNKTLIIPFEFSHHKYNQAICNNDLSLLFKIFLEMEYKLKDNVPCKYTRNEIIKRIKLIKKDLILKFNIHKLYLFGSFAKETNNENSDIDFLVILNETLINIERLDQINLIKEYLSELFECSVDVLDFTFALKELGENEMEHIITLI